jgi:hypothetical protein
MLPLLLVCLAAAGDGPTPPNIEEASLRELLAVRRVYVDHLTGGDTAAQMRDILITSLQGTRLFIVTENQERADAFLRGAAEDLVFTEVHTSSEGINAHGTLSARTGINSRDSRGLSGGAGAGDNESDHSTERRHEALASVRLVNKEGDVIWSTTQESQGARFRGASTDVADKITARLKDDFERARKLK